jgi:hypothetical protein
MAFSNQDVGVELRFTVLENGTVADLTGTSTVELVVPGQDKSPYPMVIRTPLEGLCVYTTKAGDFEVGQFIARLKVTQDATHIFFTSSVPLYVNEE